MTIRVLVDDFGLIPADALLRAADADLEPMTEAARRIDALAGPQFAELRRVREPLRRGAAVVTGGGSLRAPFVLHAVMQDAEAEADRQIVRRALIAAWQQAMAWGLEQIVAPLGEEGLGGMSAEEVTTVLCETWATAMPSGVSHALTLVVERAEQAAMVQAAAARAGRG